MVVAGIAVALALASCNTRCPTLRREQAHLAATWLNGNLAGKTWSDAQLIALACAVPLPLAMVLAARLRLLEMGDELRAGRAAPAHARRGHADRGTGRRRRRQRRRPGGLRRAGRAADRPALRARQRPLPLASALTGAALLAGADLLARHAGASGLPVGVLTAGIGGVYLAFLLLMEWKKTHDPRPAPARRSASRACAPLMLRDVTLAYGARKVLDGLSLTIPAGAFTAVVGPNGCGKSTLLRVLGGALAPSQGRALLDGADLAGLRPCGRAAAGLPAAGSAGA